MLSMQNGDTVLYKCREVMLIQRGGGYYVYAGDSEDAHASFANPLTAWACFIDVLDGRVRRRIGDMLEKDGKNRYTGEFEGVKK